MTEKAGPSGHPADDHHEKMNRPTSMVVGSAARPDGSSSEEGSPPVQSRHSVHGLHEEKRFAGSVR